MDRIKLPLPVSSCVWTQLDLNQRPSDYESPALTTELWVLTDAILAYFCVAVKWLRRRFCLFLKSREAISRLLF